MIHFHFRRLKEKYESEIEFANDETTLHKNKCNKLRDEYATKEEETIVLSAVVKTKEVSLSEMQKVTLYAIKITQYMIV